jgi:hypothetical protein
MTNDERMTKDPMTKCLDRPFRSTRGDASSFGLLICFVILFSSFGVFTPHHSAAEDDRGFVFDVAWQTERVELADGRVLRGLIEKESQTHLHFFEVRRRPGRTPALVRHYLSKDDVAKVDRLTESARAELNRRLEAVQNRAAIEVGRMNSVQLDAVDRDGVRWWSYAGPWFRLEAALEDWETRTIVVRLEQMFRGFEQVLGASHPATRNEGPKISFRVFGDHRRYAAYLRQEGLAIRNPAFFDPETLQVVVSSDLGRLHQLESAVEAEHDQLLREQFPTDRASFADALAKLDEKLKHEGYTEAERSRINRLAAARWRAEHEALQKQVQRANSRNNDEVYRERQNLERRLFHEAFHAYSERELAPVGRISNPSHTIADPSHTIATPSDTIANPTQKQARAPLWLAEGLAQIFESALFEADDLLRIDAPDGQRLARLQEDLASAAPLRLADLLAADQATFLVLHDASGRTSERHYLYAWGLAYYLVFEHAGFTPERLKDYVASADAPPLAAFEQLTGMPLPDFEAQWRKAIRDLK